MAKIIGKAGDDVISGTSSADQINGAGGNDVIHGNGGNDSIQGGDGNDMLFGDAGNDDLQGGNGNDYLDGGTGVDSLNGGDGNDVLVWDIADSMRAGGSGFDTLLVLGSGQTVDLTVLHKDQFRSIEQVDLNGSGPNTLKVSANSIHEGDHDVNALTGTPDTLIVRLGLDDIVNKGTGWTEQTPEVLAGVLYRVYTHPNSALSTSTLLIENHGPIAFDDGPISFFDTGVHDTGNTNLLSNDFGVGTLSVSSLSSLSTAGTNNNLFTISQSGLEIDITLTPAINALIPTDALYFFGLKDNTATINVSSLGVVSVNDGGGLLEFLPLSKTIKVAFDYTLNDGFGGTDTGNASVTINGVDNRDLLVAGVAGGETLSGDDNGDLLISQAGIDVLHGNGGDDYLVSGGGADQLYGDAGNDIIRGGGAGQGSTANYSADVLDSDGRAFINAAPPTPTQMDAVAQAITGGTLFNYTLSLQSNPPLFGGLTSGIVVQGVNAGAVDGTDLIVADLLTIVNQVLNPTPNSTSSVDLINFAGHIYQLYNGIKVTSGNEWISASIPAAGQEGALVVGGDFTSAAGGSYYVLQGSSGNDIMIGGNSSSTAPSFGYFLIGEGGSNVLIGGNNTASMDYYVAATDNTDGGFARPFPQTVGNSILIGGDNAGTGTYYMLGAQGNDVLMAGANASGNAYDLYYFSGGGGTNLFVSNTGKHVFDGSSGSNGATIHDGFVNHIQDTNDTAQYHQDVLGGVAAGDVRTFINAATPSFAQMDAVLQAITAGLAMNYNFSMVFDPFAINGGILVDSQNAAANIDGHDIIVVRSDTGQSSIPNIAFNESNLLTGTNHVYTLYNGPVSLSFGSVTVSAATGSGDALMIGGANANFISGNYALIGGAGNDILVGGTLSSVGFGFPSYTLSGGGGHDLLLGGINTGLGTTYTLEEIQTQTGTSGDPVGGSASTTLTNDILIAGGGNSTLIIDGTAVGGSGDIGNKTISADSLNASVTLAYNILDGGLGGTETVSLIGTATGGSATNTFGNYASDGFTAVSAQVDIHDNILNTTANDTLLIQAHAFGGNAGLMTWDNLTVNTGANVADGAGSEAISAQAIVDNNDLNGGAAGASMTIDGEATGGNTGPALYANQALNDAVAISAQVTVNDNHLDGHGDLTSDLLQITALSTGGSVGSGGFTANVSGFNPADNPGAHPEQLIPGGTATSAQAIVVGNDLTEHGTADAILTIDATATGGDGHFFGNYAFDGTAISADVQVDNNTLTGGSGNDILTIDATANGGAGPNHADLGATAIEAMLDVSGNILDGGLGNDTLALLINANPGGSNSGGAGTETLISLTALNNQLHGGDGNNTLIFNNPALLANGSGNILDGGTGTGFIDTLIQQINGANLDLTQPGVVTGTSISIIQNIEKIDLTGNGANVLTLSGANADNLNANHTLFVTGDVGTDSVSSSGTWGAPVATGITAAVAGDTLAADSGLHFDHYTQTVGSDTVHLYVQSTMTVL